MCGAGRVMGRLGEGREPAVLLLGPLECTVDDQPVVLSGWRMSGVLAALALQAPAAVSRGRLIEILWGEAPPSSAVNAVHVQVSRLRSALGQDLVQTVGGGYRLADAVQVDVRDFGAAVRDGQHALRDGDPATAEALLSGALAGWRGPVLGGAVTPGLEPDARRLEDLRLDALHTRLEADLALGRHAQVVGELRALVSSKPYDERLRGLLMIALYRSGRQDEALSVFAEGVAVLAEDLGVDPTRSLPTSTAACCATRTRPPPSRACRPADHRSPTTMRPDRRWALVHVLLGRGHELDWARAEAAYRAALAALPPGDSPTRARVQAAFSTALMLEGQFAEARSLAEDAAAVSHRVGATADEAEALTTLAVLHGQRGRAADAARLFDLARAAADASGSIRHQMRSAMGRSGILANQGAFDAAIAECRRAIEIARTHGLDRTQGMDLRTNLLGPNIDSGRLDEALEIGLEAIAIAPEGRARGGLLTQTGVAAVRRGDAELALRLQQQAEAEMRGSQQTWFVAFWSQLAAEVALAMDDHATALQRAREGFAAATSPDGAAFWAAEIGALFGEIVLAGRLEEDLTPIVAAVQAAAADGETRIAVGERLRLEAIAAQVAGRHHPAVIMAWERALAAYAELPMPQRMARCHLALTQLHLAAGDHSRARTSWAEATRLAEMIGAAPLTAAARALGRRGGFADAEDVTHTA